VDFTWAELNRLLSDNRNCQAPSAARAVTEMAGGSMDDDDSEEDDDEEEESDTGFAGARISTATTLDGTTGMHTFSIES
jgi:hypothetical protein